MKTISKKLVAIIACVILAIGCCVSAFAYPDIHACQKCGSTLTKGTFIGECNHRGCVCFAYYYSCPNSRTEMGHTSRAICDYGHIQ